MYYNQKENRSQCKDNGYIEKIWEGIEQQNNRIKNKGSRMRFKRYYINRYVVILIRVTESIIEQSVHNFRYRKMRNIKR